MGGAAIFDLDRTLLRGSSSPAFSEALFEAGLSSRRSVPGQRIMMRSYELVGETLPSMALARLAASAFKGRPVGAAEEAAQLAADNLQREVGPWLPPLLERHRAAGRSLVLATTSPRDLVRPLAARLGIDHVVATRYATRVGTDGVLRYTGGLDGGFVWAHGKLAAVRRWAARHDVDLAESWAYSDSIYDLPLLSGVGHPTAVNPDYRLLAAATLRRWPIAHFDAPPGVTKVLGAEIQDLARLTSTRAAFPYARFDITGVHHIPSRGPVIVVANHRSYFDPAAIGLCVYEAGRKPRWLAKKEMFDAPVIGPLMRTVGAIRVDRTGSPAGAFDEAEAALRAGECVVVMPQGTIPRGEDFFETRLHGKTGAARLAAATGAPVVPIGLWGTERVWPRSSRLPNMTSVLHPPRVTCRVGPPLRDLHAPDPGDPDAGDTAAGDTDPGPFDPTVATERIMDAIVALLPPEATLPHTPDEAELARTRPPGAGSA